MNILMNYINCMYKNVKKYISKLNSVSEAKFLQL